MKKIIYRSIISLILLGFVSIIYLSIVGIKTKKFNSFIISKVSEVDSNLNLNIDNVSVKLEPFSLSINLKTLGTDLFYKNKSIKLESIITQISLKSLINNQFSLTKLMISTRSLSLKNLISLIRAIKKDPKLLIAEQLIEKGFIIADLTLEFNETGKVKKNFEINGSVNNAKLSLLNKKIDQLSLNFRITDKEFIFKNINFLLNNKGLSIPKFTSQKQKNEFFFTGSLNTKKLNLNKYEIKEFFDDKFLNTYFNNIIFDLDSNFSFKIDKKFKLKDLNINSVIDINNLEFNNFIKEDTFFPKIKKKINLEKQKVNLIYNQNNLSINGSGNISIQENLDFIDYKIINKDNNYIFDVNLKIKENTFLIEFLNFEKNIRSNLDLKFKGFLKKNIFIFEEISFLEDKNFLFLKNLKLSEDHSIEEVEKIAFNFTDRAKKKNEIEIKKINKFYQITGNSYNADKLITQLLKYKNNKRQNILKNKIDLKIDIKKVNLDKVYTINHLKGSVSFNNNKITSLNLNSEFSDKKKITFTIKESNSEIITTLYSREAKPLVDRYKFIKGFSDGQLDFYSIKKDGESKSTLKIYDFKLKELPALTKVLTLASLQGIADLLSGEGIRFSEFEMNFTNKKDLMIIDEIYAIGPAISVLMEGYIEKDNLISLRGTLVPATTINKTIGSLPLIGNILVGKKVGEGVFGVSFKIKGPPKNLETSVNPIKTLTPRFITRTLDKIKKN
mgnify:CR=1 FL=1